MGRLIVPNFTFDYRSTLNERILAIVCLRNAFVIVYFVNVWIGGDCCELTNHP